MKNTKKFKIWHLAIIIVILAALAFIGRYVYVMFIDPMSAFDKPSNPTPVPTSAVSTPEPEAIDPATPEPSLSVRSEAPELSPDPTPTPEPTPVITPTPEPTPTPELDTSFMENRVNILILGWDESPERNIEGSALYRDENNNFRSDVIMLLSVNFKKDRVHLISVPRDTLADIYKSDGTLFSDTGHWKINAAFAKGGSAAGDGFGYVMTTVSKLLGGIPIDYYAGVNMEGLKAVVNAMGGVDYDVDVRIQLNGRILETGPQHLDGQQVLDYCRARKGISTDVGRADRQQRMLFTIFNQLKTRDQLGNFLNIYSSVKDYIYTNLNTEQIAALAAYAVRLDMDNLNRATLSGEYVDSTPYNGASFYCIYNEKLVELMKKIFGVTIIPNPRLDAEYVISDKAAANGLKLANGAEYIRAEVREYYAMRPELTVPRDVTIAIEELNSHISALRAVCVRQFNEDENLPFNREIIDQASDALCTDMSGLCEKLHITRSMLDKKQLPDGFYKSVPTKY